VAASPKLRPHTAQHHDAPPPVAAGARGAVRFADGVVTEEEDASEEDASEVDVSEGGARRTERIDDLSYTQSSARLVPSLRVTASYPCRRK